MVQPFWKSGEISFTQMKSNEHDFMALRYCMRFSLRIAFLRFVVLIVLMATV